MGGLAFRLQASYACVHSGEVPSRRRRGQARSCHPSASTWRTANMKSVSSHLQGGICLPGLPGLVPHNRQQLLLSKHSHSCLTCAVRLVQRKLGWKEVGDDEEWEIYWTDTSVSIERVMKLSKTQVGALALVCRCLCSRRSSTMLMC
jgi:hypothetical protein